MIRERVATKEVMMCCQKSDKELANFLTNEISRWHLQDTHDKLNTINIHPSHLGLVWRNASDMTVFIVIFPYNNVLYVYIDSKGAHCNTSENIK